MSSALRTALLVVALIAAVVAAAIFYTRLLRPDTPPGGGTVETAQPREVVIHPAIQEGLRAVDEDRLDDARSSFESVPESEPSYPLALRNLALVQLLSEDLEGASATFERLLQRQIDDPGLYGQLAWLQHRLGRDERAELEALRAIEIDPQASEARYAVALFRVAQGRLGPAIAAYDRATAADASRAAVIGALQQLIDLHERRPEEPAVHYALAYFAHRLSRLELEIEELEHYLATEPSGPYGELARRRLTEARSVAP